MTNKKQIKQARQVWGRGRALIIRSLFPTFLLVVLVVVGVPYTNISGTGNTVANAAPSGDTDSQVGLGFSNIPGPTPTGTISPTVTPTNAPTPTPSQSSPVIPDPHDPPTTNEPTVNVGTNLAKTGWVNIQTWLLAFGLLGSVLLFWAFLLVRRERDGQEDDGLVIVANTGVAACDDESIVSGLGEDK